MILPGNSQAVLLNNILLVSEIFMDNLLALNQLALDFSSKMYGFSEEVEVTMRKEQIGVIGE